VGTGKTYLALSCLKWWLREKNKGYIFTIPDILDRLKSCISRKDDTALDHIKADFANWPMLVIDDFGVQNNTLWADEQLYEIVNTRWLNRDKVITIVTSNYSPDELIARSKDEITGQRIVSRLIGMCTQIAVKGTDRRLKYANR